MFDLEGYEKPSKKELREDGAKEFNKAQGSFMRVVGENMAAIGSILVVILFIGYIWTDFKLQISFETILLDGVVTVMSLFIIESLWTQGGIKGGKLDETYVSTHNSFLAVREEVVKQGVSLLNHFCAWQIDLEYETYLRKRCNDLKIDYKDYTETLQHMSKKALKKLLGRERGRDIYKLRNIKRIELSGNVLMSDGVEASSRGGVGASAADYIKNKSVGLFNIIATIATGFCSAAIAVWANDGASWGLVMYTIMKLILLARKAFKGYSKGVKAYSVVEVKHMQDKALYLNLFLEYLKNKTYLTLGDKYGEIPTVEENKPS